MQWQSFVTDFVTKHPDFTRKTAMQYIKDNDLYKSAGLSSAPKPKSKSKSKPKAKKAGMLAGKTGKSSKPKKSSKSKKSGGDEYDDHDEVLELEQLYDEPHVEEVVEELIPNIDEHVIDLGKYRGCKKIVIHL